jgi:outer membrane protein TolC
MQALYLAGEISLLELLETGTRLNTVEAARLEASAAAARAAVRLDQAVGRSCAHK